MSYLIEIASLNRAFNDVSVSYSTFAEQRAEADADIIAFANSFDDGSMTDAELATHVLTNMGILPSEVESVVALEAALAEYFGVHGNRGFVVMQLANELATLTMTGDLAVYADAQAAWNTSVFESVAYSSDSANTVDSSEELPGQTFTLTTGVDAFVGGAGDDTFVGTSTTLGATDALIGGDGEDTLNLTLTAANNAANISGIEVINVDWNAFGTATVAAATIAGAEINLSSSKVGFLGAASVTGAGANVINAGSGMVGALTVTDATTGVEVNATNSSSVSVTGTGAATVNAGTAVTSVTTSGFSSATIDAGTATTISVTDNARTSGVTNLVTNANATITNAATGALNLTVGSGKSVTVDAIGNGLTIDGSGDATLTVTTITSEVITNNLDGALTVKTAGTGALTLTDVDADTIWLTGVKAGADTVANGANLKYSGSAGAIDITVGGSGTADTVTATLTAASTTSLTLTGVEYLNLQAAATAVSGADLTIGTLATGGKTVTLGGDNDVTLTAVTGNGTVDASGLNGALVVSGTTASLTVSGPSASALTLTSTGTATDITANGGSAIDTVTASTTTGSVTANLADGANVFSATGVTGGTAVVTGGTGIDTVTVGSSSITSGTVNINSGAGADAIVVSTGVLAGATIVVDLGAGDDAISITGGSTTTATDSITVIGGDGSDTLTLADNTDWTLGSVTLTGVEIIQLAGTADTGNAVFQAADMSGAAFTMKSDGGEDGNGFTVVGKSTTTAIDLSTLTIDRTVSKAVSATTITSSGSSQGVAITGTSVADTITGSGYADTIVAGNGADVITAGAGNDSITLTETTANQVNDTVKFSSAATNGVDTIAGFKTATDELSFLATDTTVATAAGDAAVDSVSVALTSGAAAYVLGTGAGSLTSTTADVIEITTTLSSYGDLDLDAGVDGTQLLKALSSTSTAATQLTVATAADKLYLVAYQDGNAYIYHGDAGAGNTAIVASELKLVGILTSVIAGTLVATDFEVY